MPNTDTIKQELQRRYDMCSPTNTSFRGLLVYAKHYFSFIDEAPFLKDIVKNEEKNFEPNIQADKYIEPYDFMFWPAYRDIPAMLDKALEENFETRTPRQKLLKKIGVKDESVKNKEHFFRSSLRLFHDQLLRRIVSQELDVPAVIQPTEAVVNTEVAMNLDITKESKWEELEIIFVNEFDVRIKYNGKNFITNHEKMGFSDKRKGLAPKASWKLLQLLSIQNGTIQLDGLEKSKREKLKKRKQELSEVLKDFFQITDNPFEMVNKDFRFYKMKSKLVPEPQSREDWLDKDIYDE
jgi:hypothetical protein